MALCVHASIVWLAVWVEQYGENQCWECLGLTAMDTSGDCLNRPISTNASMACAGSSCSCARLAFTCSRALVNDPVKQDDSLDFMLHRYADLFVARSLHSLM